MFHATIKIGHFLEHAHVPHNMASDSRQMLIYGSQVCILKGAAVFEATTYDTKYCLFNQ